MLTEERKAKADLDTAVIKREGEIMLVNMSLKQIIEKEILLQQVASVDIQLNESEAMHLLAIRRIAADSKKAAQLNFSKAEYAASLASIKQKSIYFQSAKDKVGMSRIDLLSGEWTKLMEKKTSALEEIIVVPKYRDIQLPSLLDIAGNQSLT